MLISEALKSSELPRAESEILLAALLKCDRAWISAHRDELLPYDIMGQWLRWLQLRARGEPISYITGVREFFGRSFRVTPDVLIPRPSTEVLVEMALDVLRNRRNQRNQRIQKTLEPGIIGIVEVWNDLEDVKTVVDVGTGSGCIAVTVALELPEIRVIATDSSGDALCVARKNADGLGVSIYRYIDTCNAPGIYFVQGDLLKPLKNLKEPFIVISNPPYLPEPQTIPLELSYEPPDALFSGEQGTELIAELIERARNHRFCSGVVFECMEEQLPRLRRK